MIDNGRRAALVIDGVFDGQAGVQGTQLAFIPNRLKKRPGAVRGAVLDGVPVFLSAQRDTGGGLWTAHYEVIE